MPTTTTADDWIFSASVNGMHFNKPTTYSMGLGVGSASTAVSGENYCTGVGYASLASSRSGENNTAVGYGCLNNATSAHSNTGIGSGAILNNQAGTDVTAVGFMALYANTGSRSTAVGSYAMRNNTTATQQSSEAFGYGALYGQTTGFWNVAVGMRALYTLSTQTTNIAMGYEALYTTNGASNIGIGHMALRTTTGSSNIGIGYQVLKDVTSGNNNIGIGYEAGKNVTTGSNNIAIGYDINPAASTGSNQLNIGNTIYGTGLGTSSQKVGIGNSNPQVIAGGLHVGANTGSDPNLSAVCKLTSPNAALTGTGQLYIQPTDYGQDYGGMISFGIHRTSTLASALPGANIAGRKEHSDSSNYATYLQFGTRAHSANILERMRITSSGNVGINDSSPSYKLEVAGTFYASGSSIEYKQEVEEYIPPEGALMSLKPVQYQYKDAWKDFGKRYAGNSSRQLGFVAEDVAKILPELAVTKTENGEEVVRNVDYEKLTVLLVSEVQNLRKEINDLKINNQIGV